jgi:hypothetical protein
VVKLSMRNALIDQISIGINKTDVVTDRQTGRNTVFSC